MPHDANDSQFDANLRRLSERLALPAAPDAQRIAAWKRDSRTATWPPATESNQHRGVDFMRRHPRLTLATALAAAIGLLVLFVTPQGNQVQAAAILRSFSESLQRGLHIQFENLGAEGVRVNGRFILAWDETDADAAQPSGSEAMLLEAAISTDKDAPEEIAGLELDARVAISEAYRWLYLRTDRIPLHFFEEVPAAAAALGVTQRGVLLDLRDLDKIISADEAAELFNVPAEIAGELRAAIQGGVAAATEAKMTQSTDDKVSLALDLGADVAAAQSHAPGTNLQVSVRHDTDASDDTSAEIEAALQDLFTGRATPAQLDSLVTALGEAAQDVSVERTAPGVHVLRASRFKTDMLDDAEATAWLERAEFVAVYREKVGVESARIEHLGPYDGKVTFEMLQSRPPASTFSDEAVRALKPGMVIDVGALAEMVGQMGLQMTEELETPVP